MRYWASSKWWWYLWLLVIDVKWVDYFNTRTICLSFRCKNERFFRMYYDVKFMVSNWHKNKVKKLYANFNKFEWIIYLNVNEKQWYIKLSKKCKRFILHHMIYDFLNTSFPLFYITVERPQLDIQFWWKTIILFSNLIKLIHQIKIKSN